jgi:sodium transport system permease protein
MFERISIVFRKELMDSLRDRRTMTGALFYPFLGPLLMFLLFSVIARTFSEQTDKVMVLPVQGAEHAPHLIEFLEQNRVQIEAAPADPETEVRLGNLDVVLIIPASYGDDFRAGRPATVQVVLDDSRQSASVNIRRTERLLEVYSGQIGALRLLARGVSPIAGQTLALERNDVSTPQSQAAGFLNLMPYFMIFAVFTGGMGIAIDATVGERERGSLEPLLINPVARAELVLGKLGVTLVFSLFAVVETLIGFAVMLNFVPLDELGVRVDLDPASIFGIFLLALPMMLLAGSLQMIIASFTRSYREAQNYLGLLPLIPALPGMFLAYLPVKPDVWNMLIPTFGQQLLINQLMRGEALTILHVLISVGVTLLVGAGLTWLAIRLYEGEQVVLGR